jgi:diacylglycerol kinase family enzyme
MYQYIYDSFLNQKKFSSVLTALENRLTDLGVSGRIDRLSLFKNVREIVSDGIRKGIKTLVVVGNDVTLNRVINTISDFNVTLGFIPIGPKNKIAKILGIPEGVTAADVLSFRRVEKLDLGQINDWVFLSEVKIFSPQTILKCEGNFNVKPEKNSHVSIYNLPVESNLHISNPQDGLLEIFIKPKAGINFFKKLSSKKEKFSEASVFLLKNLMIKSDARSAVLVDESKTLNTPAEVKIFPHKLKMIIGKERVF